MTKQRKDMVKKITDLANKVGKARNIEITTVSRLVTGDARFIGNIQDGANFTITRYEEVLKKLTDLSKAKTA